jgi:hypothetical protein
MLYPAHGRCRTQTAPCSRGQKFAQTEMQSFANGPLQCPQPAAKIIIDILHVNRFPLLRFPLLHYSTTWPGFGLYPNVNNFSSGAPRATTLATYSPIAGPFLKPCPEPPPTIHTFSISG